jgi:hypothetical protein
MINSTNSRYILMLAALLMHNIAHGIDAIPENMSGWTEQGVVLTDGPSGAWDEKNFVNRPIGFEKKDGMYYLYYNAGSEGCWNQHADTRHQSVGLATSTDGKNFTKFAGNPILIPHDFVNVSSHEEGIRGGAIRFVPEMNKWLGYFGVESPGGSQSCPFMGSSSECGCNISVDASVFAATSDDGTSWTVQGAVSGAYNSSGIENYPNDFHVINGTYHLWTHRAEGGNSTSFSSSSNYMSLTPRGSVSVCNRLSRTFLHDDNSTVTLFYYDLFDECGSPASVYFSTTSLANPRATTNKRVIHNSAHQDNYIYKDVDAGVWRWYYNVKSGSQAGSIQLRTHPINGNSNTVPNAPMSLIISD